MTTRLSIMGLFVLLQSLDILTTYLGLRNGAREINVLPSWLLGNAGEMVMYAFKACLVLLVLTLVLSLEYRFPRIWLALRIVNVLMIFVLGLNLLAIV
ncbi:MAG: DUF5658 family protein [Dehalococcoidales bacterium]|nr:DUF5658 family protein [Dehalococcoidales bacterium]